MLFFSIGQCKENKIIKKEFSLCEKTDVIIELTSNCEDLPLHRMLKCEIFKNELNFLSKLEDQFNFVQSPNGNMVVYSLSRYLYVASCDVIKEVKIPEKVNRCTRDLPVIITDSTQHELIVYLSKEGILRHNSEEISCIQEYDFFETSNVQIVRQNNLITTVEKIKKKVHILI